MNVIIDNKINVLEKIKAILKGGHIIGMYRECDRIYAENILKELVREYRITKKIYPTNTENSSDIVEDMKDIKDDVRLILVFGGDNMIECAKYAATMLGLPLVVVLTTPLRVMSDNSYIFNNDLIENHKSVEPKLVIANKDILQKRNDFSSVVGGYSVHILKAVEKMFRCLIQGEGYRGIDNLKALINVEFSEENKVDMLKKCYTLDYRGSCIVDKIAYTLAHNSKSLKSASNYQFAITYIILLMYKGFVGHLGNDLVLPPDIVESAKRCASKYGFDISDAIIGYRMMTSSEYMRITHIMREYKDELYNALEMATNAMGKLSKVYRRVSRDAGYNMFEDISLDEIMESISLLSIFETENTPLRVMKAGGYLERYLKNVAV